MSEEKFEEGKPVEEYINELNSIPVIEPEPNPEATQRLETVVEEPVRNKNAKKPEPKKQEPQKTNPTPTAPQSVTSQPAAIATVATTVNPEPQTPPSPVTQPDKNIVPNTTVTQPNTTNTPPTTTETPQAATPPIQTQQPLQFRTFDEYLAYRAANIQNEYTKAGAIASQDFLNNTYNGLIAMASGEAVLVPVSQLQKLQQPQVPPQPPPTLEPEPKVETPPQLSLIQQLKQLDEGLKDPSLAPVTKKAIMKKKYELLGLPYQEETLIEPISTSPVNPKKVNEEKPKKRPLKLKEKAMLSGVGISVTVLVILTIIYFIH